MTSPLAPLAIAVPLLIACLLVATGHWLPRALRDAAAAAAAAATAALDAALLAKTGAGDLVTWSGGWTPHRGVSVGIALSVDQIGAGLALVAAGLVLCALIFSWRYFEDAIAHWQSLLLLFLTGMTGFALSGDLFNMVVFFELMGAAAYALTAFHIEDKQAVQGGLNFAVINSLGAYFSLMGLALVYGRTGRLGLAQISQSLAGHRADVLIVLAFVLISTGWLVKAAVVPFHFWTADAEAVAPSPVCAVLSGAMVELGVYGVARVYWTAFEGSIPASAVRPVLLALGAATAIVGALMCLAQHNVKRLLAYSTIAHVGLFLMAVGTLTSDGLAGAAVYLIGHAGVKGGLFLLAGILLNRYGSADVRQLHGRGQPRDPLAWVFLVAGLALAALPPFATGLGKALCEEALHHAGQSWTLAVFVGVSASTGGAVVRATARVFFGLGDRPGQSAHDMTDSAAETEGRLHRVPATMWAALSVLLFGALAAGLVPGLGRAVAASAERFVDRAAFVGRVLYGRAPVHPPAKDLGWTLSGILLDLGSVALALVIVTLSLWWSRVPKGVRRLSARMRPVMNVLHAAHSGHIGDYVSWLLLGVAGIAAAVWAALPG